MDWLFLSQDLTRGLISSVSCPGSGGKKKVAVGRSVFFRKRFEHIKHCDSYNRWYVLCGVVSF